jgi:glyoxylase-like metal-dependent hydrolase (beta-lactamase superfamily II)
MIHTLKYSNTNTYLIEGENGKLLFDTGWAGTFPAFCHAMGELGISVQSIDYVLISHFHPDHCGIAQDIADTGARILVVDVQKEYVHFADAVFEKEGNLSYKKIKDDELVIISEEDSRHFLNKLGIEGRVIRTPGHSNDSVSLVLDEGAAFVGDLNPLYELEMHKGTEIENSWKKLLADNPKAIYYGHAKPAFIEEEKGKRSDGSKLSSDEKNFYNMTEEIVRMIDKGKSVDKICKKTKATPEFVQDVMRMYLTHPGVSVQGILDRIDIKNR